MGTKRTEPIALEFVAQFAEAIKGIGEGWTEEDRVTAVEIFLRMKSPMPDIYYVALVDQLILDYLRAPVAAAREGNTFRPSLVC